jgi:FkbM family methyltransferase
VAFLTRYGAATVIAVEPDPRNFDLLRLNVTANGLTDRTVTLQLALTDHDGAAKLELSDENIGDHRIRVAESHGGGREARRRAIEVPAARLDTLVERGQISIEDTGIAWIDTQGHEAHVLAGAHTLLTSDVPMVIEYWPYGLRRAAGLELLHEIVAEHFAHVIDLRTGDESQPRLLPASELPNLERSYGWCAANDHRTAYTDLLLARELRPL